jgi:hypothetical protein
MDGYNYSLDATNFNMATATLMGLLHSRPNISAMVVAAIQLDAWIRFLTQAESSQSACYSINKRAMDIVSLPYQSETLTFPVRRYALFCIRRRNHWIPSHSKVAINQTRLTAAMGSLASRKSEKSGTS